MTGGHAERRVVVRDVRALSTLAHPLRLRLLDHLLAVGPRTARQCAAALGESGANCSYHLRHLARYGLVERAAGDDGRERPWQAAATGFEFAGDPADPATGTARAALLSVQLDQQADLLHRYLAREQTVDEPWRAAAALNRYALSATADELRALVDTLDAAIRPLVAATRADPPADARPVYLGLQAVLSPDAG